VTCPQAKDIGSDSIRGCSATARRMSAGNNFTTYRTPCTEACYNGNYTECPTYKESKEKRNGS